MKIMKTSMPQGITVKECVNYIAKSMGSLDKTASRRHRAGQGMSVQEATNAAILSGRMITAVRRLKILLGSILAAAALGLVGCASQMAWYNPSVRDNTQIQRDFAECKYDTTKYGYVPNQYYGVGDPVAAGITAGIEQAMRSNEVMRTCMQSKGYTLQNIKDHSDLPVYRMN